jgi:nucleotide-binding universal stress UspA family protein
MSTDQVIVGVDASAVSWLALLGHRGRDRVGWCGGRADRRRRPGDLVVVGNRGHSEFAATLTGSTCQQVALHAPASVAVIRPQRTPEAGPVVVGYDGSPTAEAVLAAASDQAQARVCGLVVVRAFRPATPARPVDAPPPTVFNAATTRTAITTGLEAAVASMAAKYPEVEVELRVAGGDSAQLRRRAPPGWAWSDQGVTAASPGSCSARSACICCTTRSARF